MPPAARVGDQTLHTAPMPASGVIMPPGVPTVMIGGQPAANLTSMIACTMVPPSLATPNATGPHPPGPPFLKGSSTVMIGGQPAIRVGDQGCVAPGAMVLPPGCPTVMIGG